MLQNEYFSESENEPDKSNFTISNFIQNCFNMAFKIHDKSACNFITGFHRNSHIFVLSLTFLSL